MIFAIVKIIFPISIGIRRNEKDDEAMLMFSKRTTSTSQTARRVKSDTYNVYIGCIPSNELISSFRRKAIITFITVMVEEGGSEFSSRF